jgi:hypothetical protein
MMKSFFPACGECSIVLDSASQRSRVPRHVFVTTAITLIVVGLAYQLLQRHRQQRIIADFEKRGFLLDCSEPVLPAWAINTIPIPFRWQTPGFGIDSFFHQQCKPGEKFTDDDLRKAVGLTGLRYILLSDMPITDAGLVHLKGLSGLEGLVLHSMRITDAGAANFKGLTNLELLDLANTEITDAGLANLAGMTKLERLYFSTTTYPELQPASGRTPPSRTVLPETAITNAGLVHLRGLKRLRQLILENMPITDAGLPHLAGLTRLEVVDLKGTKVTPAGVARLKRALPATKIEGP